MRRVILDTETTGLESSDRIIEIGCVEMRGRSLTGVRWHKYINPERAIHPEATKVHGITDDDVRDRPLFSAVADDFIQFIRGAEVIAHNAEFDVGMLDRELERAGKEERMRSVAKVTDTLKLARAKFPGKRNTLDMLCKRYQIDTSSRDLHGALIDAVILADLYIAMTREQGKLELVADTNNAEVIIRHKIDNLVVIKATPEELAAQEALFAKHPEMKKGPARHLVGRESGG